MPDLIGVERAEERFVCLFVRFDTHRPSHSFAQLLEELGTDAPSGGAQVEFLPQCSNRRNGYCIDACVGARGEQEYDAGEKRFASLRSRWPSKIQS